jgi:hypothetical protein
VTVFPIRRFAITAAIVGSTHCKGRGYGTQATSPCRRISLDSAPGWSNEDSITGNGRKLRGGSGHLLAVLLTSLPELSKRQTFRSN